MDSLPRFTSLFPLTCKITMTYTLTSKSNILSMITKQLQKFKASGSFANFALVSL